MDVMIPINECDEPCKPCDIHQDAWMHDACCCIPGLQVKPKLYGDVTVGFYAVVTDPEGVDHVDHVYADVWHPDGTFKYQIELIPVGFDDPNKYNKWEAIEIWNHTWKCHRSLVKLSDFIPQPGFDQPGDIYEELLQEEAYLYRAFAVINYCQPGGWYYVGVRAHDGFDAYCNYLYNRFWYIPTAGIDLDFKTIDYGTVAESSNKWIGGDEQFGTLKPTVRNTGNTPVRLTVKQDDMQFGETAGKSNVDFDVRLTANGPVRTYLPGAYDLIKPASQGGQDIEGNRYRGVLIPGRLELCTEEKLDFSIHVWKGYPGMTYKGMMEICAYVDLPTYIWSTPGKFQKSAPLGVPPIYIGPINPGPPDP
jgi:hypothetical protein